MHACTLHIELGETRRNNELFILLQKRQNLGIFFKKKLWSHFWFWTCTYWIVQVPCRQSFGPWLYLLSDSQALEPGLGEWQVVRVWDMQLFILPCVVSSMKEYDSNPLPPFSFFMDIRCRNTSSSCLILIWCHKSICSYFYKSNQI